MTSTVINIPLRILICVLNYFEIVLLVFQFQNCQVSDHLRTPVT